MIKNALIVFTRNPILGKVKTRLAKTIGDKAALDIYTFLLNHTKSLVKNLDCDILVYFTEKIENDLIWSSTRFIKKLQKGKNLGERMEKAFEDTLSKYDKAVIIGSDLYDLHYQDIQLAFDALDHHKYVLGPAKDGGYYLLGMKKLYHNIFKNKSWGTATVLQETLSDIKGEKILLLKERNDIDCYEDIKNIEVFEPFLKKIIIE